MNCLNSKVFLFILTGLYLSLHACSENKQEVGNSSTSRSIEEIQNTTFQNLLSSFDLSMQEDVSYLILLSRGCAACIHKLQSFISTNELPPSFEPLVVFVDIGFASGVEKQALEKHLFGNNQVIVDSNNQLRKSGFIMNTSGVVEVKSGIIDTTYYIDLKNYKDVITQLFGMAENVPQ
jgi:hypothetical protein